jgi:hypothetical protein
MFWIWPGCNNCRKSTLSLFIFSSLRLLIEIRQFLEGVQVA